MSSGIEILAVSRFKYDYENTSIMHCSKALKKLEIPHRIVHFEGFSNYIQQTLASPPRAILSFRDPFAGEKPLGDFLEIPHYFWPQKGFEGSCYPLFSPRSCTITQDSGLHSSLLKMDRASFLLKKGCDPQESLEKSFEITAFEDLIELHTLREGWSQVFCEEELKIINEALEICESRNLHPFEALVQVLESNSEIVIKRRISDFYFCLSKALNAKNFLPFLPHFLARVDFFGEHAGASWLTRIPKNTFLHWKLVYSEHFKALGQSKIHLCFRPPQMKELGEWFYPALCSGCLPLIQVHVGQEKKYPDISFTSPQEMQMKIDFYLRNPDARQWMITQLMQENTTWERCAQALTDELFSENSFSYRR